MSEQLKDKAMKKSGYIKTINRKERKVFIYYQNIALFAKNLCGHCGKIIIKKPHYMSEMTVHSLLRQAEITKETIQRVNKIKN